MAMRLGKLGSIKGAGVGRQVQSNTPSSAGSRNTDYVAGFNPRKGRYSASVGTAPKVQTALVRPAPAPFKHEAPLTGKFNIEGFKS